MHALEDQLLWPGRFGGGGTDWEVPGALESMANQAVRDLAVTPHAFGPTLSVMQLVDWHCKRRVPLSLSVEESLA